MATRRMATGHSCLGAFVDDVLDDAALPIHLKREARADFIAHLEADVAMAMKNGLSEDEAIESAIRSFGAISEVRHALRSAADAAEPRGRHRLAMALDGLACDLRDAVRNLWARRATSAVAVATLATGIGVTSAAYAVFDWVVVRPLPYPAAHELVRVFAAGTNPITAPSDLAYGEFETIAKAAGLRATFAYSSATRVLAAPGVEPTHVIVARTTGDLFGTLGIALRVGRAFTREEIASGARQVVLSERFWRTRLNGSDVVEQMVTIDGVAYTVAGVMPSGRGYPRDADVWRPLTPAERDDDDQEIVTIARRAAGVSLAAATAEVGALAGTATRGTRKAWLEDVHRSDVRDVRGALTILMALSALILAIACTNVAALLSGRSIDRAGELAVRGAMGASRSRLVRQLAVEYLLLAMVGGAAGLVIGEWSLAALRALAPVAIPRLDEVAIDGRIFLAGSLASVCSGAIIGLSLALRTTRQPLVAAIQLGGSVRTTPPRVTAQAFAAAQAAIAVVLLVAAALLGRALQHLLTIDNGFDPDGLIAVHLYMRGPDSPDPHKVFPQLIDTARETNGVTAAAVALRLPTQIGSVRSDIEIPGLRAARVIVRPITNDYFAVTHIALLQGRTFASVDTRGADRVMIVNEAFTRDVLRGAPALGLRVKSDLVDEPLTIVGVVADISPAGEADRPAIYVALDQLSVAGGALLVRATVPPGTVLPELRGRLRAVAPTFPLDRVTVIAEALGEGRATTRFLTQLSATFGGIALVLAMLGVYGLTCREIAARWRELAVRQALGATPRDVLWQAIRPGMVALVLGGAVGAVVALGTARWVSSLIAGVVPLTPATLAMPPVLLAIVGTIVALTATRRVLRGDAAATLRQ